MKTSTKKIKRSNLTEEELYDLENGLIGYESDKQLRAIIYDGVRYLVSDKGIIYKKMKMNEQYKIMATHIQTREKYKYCMFKGTTVHKIVAFAFGLIDDYNTNLDVHHKNGNKKDNNLSNLAVFSHSEARKKSSRYKYYCEKIIDGRLVKNGPFECQKDISEFLGCKSQSHIALAISGAAGFKTVYGWKVYRDEN